MKHPFLREGWHAETVPSLDDVRDGDLFTGTQRFIDSCGNQTVVTVHGTVTGVGTGSPRVSMGHDPLNFPGWENPVFLRPAKTKAQVVEDLAPGTIFKSNPMQLGNYVRTPSGVAWIRLDGTVQGCGSVEREFGYLEQPAPEGWPFIMNPEE